MTERVHRCVKKIIKFDKGSDVEGHSITLAGAAELKTYRIKKCDEYAQKAKKRLKKQVFEKN